MSKYHTYERRARPMRRNEPHPIWRGIGCFTMLLVPAMSLALSIILVEEALKNGFPIPRELLGWPTMPPLLFHVPGLVKLLNWIESLNNLYAILAGAFILTLFLGSVFALIYAFAYRVVGPPRYTALDAPPPNVKTRRYKR
jgi:hypothetical protein